MRTLAVAKKLRPSHSRHNGLLDLLVLLVLPTLLLTARCWNP